MGHVEGSESMEADMRSHLAVKRMLKASGLSFSEVARQMGRTTTTVLTASMGRCRSRPAEIAIATALGTTPEALWPHRYHTRRRF
ncbi:helix-turn-helix domain-containing protein [Haematobacter massiliensis]|uniref:helix-turn-helix domain-containing protein n=2 Tax=Haematobacter massiliensis TaxID=195105 RepID=UPI00112518C0